MKIPEVLLIEVEHAPGNLAKVLTVVGEAGLTVENLGMISRAQSRTLWELTLDMEEGSGSDLIERIDALPIARLIGRSDRVFTRHEGGKIETVSRVALGSQQILRDIYTPGVARVCRAIQADPAKAREYTGLGRTVAIVTNGTAILGLGDIGPVAGMPVMEGKAALFHAFAGLSGIPILIESKDPQVIIDTVTNIAPSFGAIQLEDIAAPECFEIEAELMRRLDIPVLHDDQHGTAVVALAALMSGMRMMDRDLRRETIGQIGLGAAGIGIGRLLRNHGVERLLGTDLDKDAQARFRALGGQTATLSEVMASADVIIATTGVKGLIQPEMVRPDQMIFALSNPEPEIEPLLALERGACFAADGKNINNVLGFPGLFRGALDAGVREFDRDMLIAAAKAISQAATDGQLVPNPLDRSVHDRVAAAVARAASG